MQVRPRPNEPVYFRRDDPGMVDVEAHAPFHSQGYLDRIAVILTTVGTGATSATKRPDNPLTASALKTMTQGRFQPLPALPVAEFSMPQIRIANRQAEPRAAWATCVCPEPPPWAVIRPGEKVRNVRVGRVPTVFLRNVAVPRRSQRRSRPFLPYRRLRDNARSIV